MNQMSIAQFLPFLVTAISILASIVLLWKYWHEVSFWRMNFFYNWPFIGRMSKYKSKRYLQQDQKTMWYAGETRICADFYPYYKKYIEKDVSFFNKCVSYIENAGETGRKSTPIWLWLTLVPIVVIEAFLFGLVVGALQEGLSSNQAKIVAYGFAYLLAFALVPLTKITGHELYNNSLIKKIRLWHDEDRKKDIAVVLRPNNKVSLINNDIDSTDADYIKMLNRLKNVNADVQPSYWYTLMTTFFLVAIAVLSFVMRARLEQELIVQAPWAGYASLLIFSFLFVVIQLIGILAGYIWGFASKQGNEAWSYISQFHSVDEFKEYFESKKEYIANLAQNRLSEFQTNVLNSTAGSIDCSQVSISGRSFLDYAAMQYREKTEHQKKMVSNGISSIPEIPNQQNQTNEVEIVSKHIECCGKVYKDGDKFCVVCGQPLSKNRSCPQCGIEVSDDSRFCSKCGGEIK